MIRLWVDSKLKDYQWLKWRVIVTQRDQQFRTDNKMAKKKKQQLVVAKHINPKLGQLKKGFITKYRGTLILLGFKMCDDFGSEESGGSDSRQKFGRRSESRLHLSASCLHPCCFITPLNPPPLKMGNSDLCFGFSIRTWYWLSAEMVLHQLIWKCWWLTLYQHLQSGDFIMRLKIKDISCCGWLPWVVIVDGL